MKNLDFSRYIIMAVLIMLLLVILQSFAGKKVHVMNGTIVAIDPSHETVFIDGPPGNAMFTVGGRLSSKAVLHKGGRLVNLNAFKIGDHVTVKWRATNEGRLIEVLESTETG